MNDPPERLQARALTRYQVISAYLAIDPPRGQRGPLLEQLASKTWVGPDGEPLTVAAETIRAWVRRYRGGGLAGLQDKPRPRRGVQVLTPDQVDLVCQLKQEVPERSIDRIIVIAEGLELVSPELLRRSTVHRVLQSRGLSARRCRTPDAHDLDRFEADFANDLWQSDMLTGPWLPDPERPGKMRRAYLYAFLDDHSRLLLHGRFSFKGDLPALELVFRRALQRFGVPRRAYYDNGQVYRSGHMRQIVATLGIHRLVFTKPRRPMGHGKIEALNRLIRAAFIAELKATDIATLDALNEAFIAWADYEYNRKTHSETGQTPLQRWRKDIERVRYADNDELLRQAFLWREKRTPDKTGVFSLFGCRYQVGPELAKRRVEVRYDPEALDEVEVWHEDSFAERVKPFEVRTHRRPRPKAADQPPEDSSGAPSPPVANWLGGLVQRRRQEAFIEPDPRQLAAEAIDRRVRADQAVIDLLADRLDDAVFDEAAVREFLDRYGPLDLDRATAVIDRMVAHDGRTDHHVTVYLDALRADATKDQR